MPPLRFDKLLDINSVLELGYSVHVSNDAKTENTKAGRTARQLLEEFLAWRAPLGSPDYVYLFKVRQLILTLGQGITRRKQTYLKECEAADHKRAEDLKQLNTSRNDDFWYAFWFRAATAAGIMAVAAAIGFALSESVLPFVPLHTEQHQEALNKAGFWPSILVAGVFAAVSRNIAKWLAQQKLEKVFRDYEIARQQAWIRYQKGKLKEYERTEDEVRRIFFDYTGRKAAKCVSYAAILNEEISTDKSLHREREKLSASIMTKTLLRFQQYRKARALAKRKKLNGTNGEAAKNGAVKPPAAPNPKQNALTS